MIIVLKEDAVVQDNNGYYAILFGKSSVLKTIKPEYMPEHSDVHIVNQHIIDVKDIDMYDQEEITRQVKLQCFFVYEEKRRKYIAIPKEMCEVPKIWNGYHNY